MKTNFTEMKYNELNENMLQLNAQVEELNRQLTELSARKEELIVEIQNRKQQIVADYILHMKQLMATTRAMIEMGIDPATIAMEEVVDCEDTASEHSDKNKNNEDTCVSSIECTTTEKEEEPIIETPVEVCEPNTEKFEEETTESEEEDMAAEPMEDIKPSGKLLTPFYEVWGFRKGAFPKSSPAPAWKHNAPRLHTPFEILCKGPVNKCLNMGNLQYRESYSTPDETRIYSADGIAPTLTRVHSDLMVMIGNDPHTLNAA